MHETGAGGYQYFARARRKKWLMVERDDVVGAAVARRVRDDVLAGLAATTSASCCSCR